MPLEFSFFSSDKVKSGTRFKPFDLILIISMGNFDALFFSVSVYDNQFKIPARAEMF